jgi:hypothetical protein
VQTRAISRRSDLSRGWRMVFLAPALTLWMAGPLAGANGKRLDSEGRIALIRGLASEIAVAKVPLPRGPHGIYLDSHGRLDEAEARREALANGTAISPGMPIDITKIAFKPKAVVFEINHGGKKRKKWYQHIEIGMGTATQPIAPQDPNAVFAYGSWITVKFPDGVPDLTVDQMKQILSGALDFSRKAPTALYSPSLPPQFKEAIKNHQVLVGMDRDAVLSAKGPPDRKVRTEEPDGGEKEDWIYGLPPHVLFVTFEGDTVVRVKQY